MSQNNYDNSGLYLRLDTKQVKVGASIARLCFEKKLFHKRESHIQGREAGRGPKDASKIVKISTHLLVILET